MMRGLVEWSQEMLAELSGLTLRSTPRTETGQQVSIDTKRDIARAFGCDGLDFFMRPITAMFPEKLEAYKA
jgi:DNA-binding XRE family transcriptional regulator